MDRLLECTKHFLRAFVIWCDSMVKYFPSAKTTIFFGTWLIWMFSIISVTKCHFMSIGDGAHVGLFSKPFIDIDGSNLGCIRYSPTYNFDSMFSAGRAFGVISLTSITLSLLLISTVFCWCPREKRILWSLARYSFAFGTVAQMFVFLALGSDQCNQFGCSLSRSGVLAVFNTVLEAVLSIVLFIESSPTTSWLEWNDNVARQDADKTVAIGSHEVKNSSIVTHHLQARGFRSRVPTLEAIQEVDSVDPENDVSVVIPNAELTNDAIDLDELQSLRWFRCATVALTTIAWAMIISGIKRCQLILLAEHGDSSEIYAGLGLFSQTVEAQGKMLGCVAYPSRTIEKFDGAFRAGRCFGTISALLMTCILLLNLYQLFSCNMSTKVWFCLRVLLPSTLVSYLLSFTAFGTEACNQNHLAECHVGKTGVVAILNVLVLVMLSIFFHYIPSPKVPIFKLSSELVIYFTTLATSAEDRWNTWRTNQNVSKDNSTNSQEHDNIDDGIQNHFYHGNDNRQSTNQTVESMSVQVFFTDREKKTVKTLYHPDGSQTITTTVEELYEEEDTDSCSEGDCSISTR